MGRKIRKKGTKAAARESAGANPPPAPPPHQVQTFNDETTGFGGLPDRDLKKNLGCG